MIFINEGLSNSLSIYLDRKNNKSYNKGYYYLLTVMDILVKIYGEFNIINPYKIKYEKTFINNLTAYGLSTKDISLLFDSINDYYIYLNSNSCSKTSSINNINKVLIKMVLLKNLYHEIDKDEALFYDNYFGLKDLKYREVIKMSTYSYEDVYEYWERKKKIYLMDSELVLTKVEPNLLTNTMYERHGLKINEVMQLSNIKVNEVNDLINENESKRKNSPFKLVLTSGSGIIDTIVLFSIVLTEIFVGFLIAIFWR